MPIPRLTFLIAAHNAQSTILQSAHSVLNQSFPHLELLIIDDGSTDQTLPQLQSLRDPRLRILSSPKNLGLAAALNLGLQQAQSEFIARLDADDLALPNRAALQIQHLDRHPEIAVLGSAIETFSHPPSPGTAIPGPVSSTIIHYPTDPNAVAATLLFRSALAHPAITFRRAALQNLRYDPQFIYAQDYALWFECLKQNLALANLPEPLTRYRLHANQLSSSMDRMQKEGTAIRSRFLQWFVPDITPEELQLHDQLSQNQLRPNAAFLHAALAWLEKLAATNTLRQFFNHPALLRTLTGRYVALRTFAKKTQLPQPQSALLAPYVTPA